MKPSNDRRKELLREYKRSPKDMGVYLIRNTMNGKCFVSSNRNIRARINRHKMDLKTNCEKVTALQQDWNKFGPDAFEFETVDLLTPMDDVDYDPKEDLLELEQLWLDKLNPYGTNGYNSQK